MGEIQKKCGECGRTKPITEYYKHKSGRYGVSSACKVCQGAYNKTWRLKNREKLLPELREYHKAWYLKNRDKHLSVTKEYDRANPEKIRAQGMVRTALRNGTLARQPCLCGEAKVDGHHPDYSQPLNVEWLCRSCHKNAHLATAREVLSQGEKGVDNVR